MLRLRRHPRATLFPYTTLFRSLLVVFGLVALMLMREASRGGGQRNAYSAGGRRGWGPPPVFFPPMGGGGRWGDRKSTRLNSSHLGISYAVFCLKKKTDTSGVGV